MGFGDSLSRSRVMNAQEDSDVDCVLWLRFATCAPDGSTQHKLLHYQHIKKKKAASFINMVSSVCVCWHISDGSSF